MKLQISLDDDLVKKIDSYAKLHYMSRSGLISLTMTQFLSSEDLKSALFSLSSAMNRIADMGSIDEESRRQLRDLETFCKVVSRSSSVAQ